MSFRKGDTVRLILSGAGFDTFEQATVAFVRKGEIWLDNGPGNDPTGPFNQAGRYLGFTIGGFSQRIEEES